MPRTRPLTLAGCFGIARRAPAAPRYRSWELHVSRGMDEDGRPISWTAIEPTKRQAIAEKAWFEAQGYTVSGPHGSTRKL